MKKNIYMLLNDVSTDTSGYPDTELDEEQLKKYRVNLKKQIGRKRREGVYAALGPAACILLVAAFLLSRPVKQRMRASTGRGNFSISSLVGGGAELEELSMHIDQTQRLDDGYVTLNTVAIDDGQILIYSTYVYDDAEAIPRLSNGGWGRDYDSPFRCMSGFLCVPVSSPTGMNPYNLDWKFRDDLVYMQRMFINGEEIVCDITADTYADEKGVVQDVARYNFHTDTLEYPAQVRLELYRNSEGVFMTFEKEAATFTDIEPEATFEFTLERDMILENEKDVVLDETIVLPDGPEFKITRFVYNAMGVRLYGEFPGGCDWSDYRGLDIQSVEKWGKSEWFSMTPISDTEVIFTPRGVNSIYSLIPEFEEWEFEFSLYKRDEETKKTYKVDIDQRITVPIN